MFVEQQQTLSFKFGIAGLVLDINVQRIVGFAQTKIFSCVNLKKEL